MILASQCKLYDVEAKEDGSMCRIVSANDHDKKFSFPIILNNKAFVVPVKDGDYIEEGNCLPQVNEQSSIDEVLKYADFGNYDRIDIWGYNGRIALSNRKMPGPIDGFFGAEIGKDELCLYLNGDFAKSFIATKYMAPIWEPEKKKLGSVNITEIKAGVIYNTIKSELKVIVRCISESEEPDEKHRNLMYFYGSVYEEKFKNTPTYTKNTAHETDVILLNNISDLSDALGLSN